MNKEFLKGSYAKTISITETEFCLCLLQYAIKLKIKYVSAKNNKLTIRECYLRFDNKDKTVE